MKVASVVLDGRPTYGIVSDGGFVQAPKTLRVDCPSLKQLIEAGRMDDLVNGSGPALSIDDLTFLPVVPDPDKIVLIGLNYESHRIETGHEPLEYPTIFIRFANSQVGHGDPMIKPRVSDKFDYEGELAFVIGKPGFEISEERALDHVAGYSCYNDGSIRDWQRHGQQWTPGKNFAKTGSFGPWMVTADEIPDVSKLQLSTRLNGEVVQSAGLDDLIFSVEKLIAYISAFTELVAGDVIVTGTTGGVGHKRNPPLFMKDGDLVEVEISGIGTLSNPIQNQ